MLCLSRRKGEKIIIDDSIEIIVQHVSAGRVRLAINAPDRVAIVRGELVERQREQERERAETTE